MPRGDGTGSNGLGPMTVRGMGRGRGLRKMYDMTGTPGWVRYGANPNAFQPSSGPASVANKKASLQNQADFLEKQLNQVHEQLSSLKEAE